MSKTNIELDNLALPTASSAPIDLLKDPIWKALFFMALPATIGFVFNTLYNVIDLIYARSWNGPEGTSTQDALGATFPLFFLQLAFGIGLYQGATALISNAYGRGDSLAARNIAIQATTFGFLIGLIVALVGVSLLFPALATVQGLGGTELNWASGYMVAIYSGGPLIIANFALFALLSGAGNNLAFGISLSAAFFLNMIFNYVFMHVFGWGLVGLGVGTVLLQGPLNFLYVAWEVKRLGALRGVRLKDFWPQRAQMLEIGRQALPASISMLIVAVHVLLINGFASSYQPGTLGGLSAAARIEQVMLLPIIGVGIGALAIIGQNYGAGQIDRVRATFWLTSSVILGFTVLATLVLTLFPTSLANLVATPGREADVASDYLFYIGFGSIFFGFLYAATSFKTGMRQPLYSAGANLMRLVVLPVGFIAFFQTLTDEFFAIAWGNLLATILAGIITYAWVARSVFNLKDDG